MWVNTPKEQGVTQRKELQLSFFSFFSYDTQWVSQVTNEKKEKEGRQS
jgi:hypothetical protein